MTKFLLLLCALTATSQSWATNTSAGATPTPYQKMKSLYDQGTPMTLNQFMETTDPALKSWNCVGANPNTTVAQLAPMNNVPAHTQAKIVVSPATPSDGPLFPGTAEQDAWIDVIVFIPNDGSYAQTADDLGKIISGNQFQLSTSPGVSESFLDTNNDPSTRMTVTYKINNGLVIMQQEATNSTQQAKVYEYAYCYKN